MRGAARKPARGGRGAAGKRKAEPPAKRQRPQQGGKRRSRSQQGGERQALDVYEAEDGIAEEEKNPMRFDDVERFEYSGLPENFDDEEIDEDEAFNSEDEEKYGDLLESFASRGGAKGGAPKKGAPKKGAAASDEDESEDADEDGGDDSDESGEFQDLSDLLGASEPPKSGAEKSRPPAGKKAARRDEGEEDSEPEIDDDEEDGDDKLHEAMLEAAGLKRKRGRDASKKEPERHEHIEESELNLDAGSGGEGGTGVSLRDLVGGLKDTTGYGGLKKQLEKLSKAQAAPAPLEGPAQERAGRSVAYGEAAKEISKWVPVVKRNREAEQLRFPLNAPPKQNLSSAALTSKFETTTGLEKEVASLLEESGLAENSAAKGEELEMKKLTVEEVKARQAELAKMRSLLFYHELKCKRIKKIKSKTYHKIAKKERERELAKAADSGALDEEQARELEMKAARERAKERMSLKHRSKSKWMRRMLEHGDRDDLDTREAIAEHLKRSQDLRRKAEGVGSDSGSDSEGGGGGGAGGSEDEEEAIDAMIESERRELEEMQAAGGKQQQQGKGLLALKFMQKAAEKKRQEARELLDELVAARAEAAEGGGASEGDEDERAAPAPSSKSKAAAAAGGRRLVGVSGAAAAAAADGENGKQAKKRARAVDEVFEQESDAGSSSDGEGEEAAAPARASRGGKKGAATAAGDAAGEGKKLSTWEQMELPDGSVQVDGVGMSRGRKTRTSGAVAAGAAAEEPLFKGPTFSSDQPAPAPAAGTSSSAHSAKPAAKGKGGAAAGAAAPQEPDEEAGDNPWLKRSEAGTAKRGKEAKKAGGEGLTAEDLILPEDAEAGGSLMSARPADQQLIERAFAAPDLQKEFEEEKAKEVADSLPALDVVVLPGWGAWGGDGARPSKMPKFAQEAAKKHAAAQAKALAERKDAGLKHVVVNEKYDAKAAKFALDKVPHPYKTREQYERAMRNPLGKDWTPALAHRSLVAPKIVTQAGTIIEPIKQKSKKSVAKASTRKPLGASAALT
eukprot:tig00020554_g10806.t1